MNREKEREDAKRRDIFLHISDAELLGDLPVDGQVNKALYDEVTLLMLCLFFQNFLV